MKIDILPVLGSFHCYGKISLPETMYRREFIVAYTSKESPQGQGKQSSRQPVQDAEKTYFSHKHVTERENGFG